MRITDMRIIKKLCTGISTLESQDKEEKQESADILNGQHKTQGCSYV